MVHRSSAYVFVIAFELVLSGGARGDAFSSYQKIGTFALPPGAAMFDALPDGRVITISGNTIYTETKPGSGQFALLGSLEGADFPSFGAAFLCVSPDGTRIAVGNNGGSSFANFLVGVFELSGLSGQWYAAPHFDGTWADNQRIALTAGAFGSPGFVTVLDANSIDPQTPINPTVISGIGGSSGGIAFDAQGNLFTGNGFAGAGPSGTGAVKAFSSDAWETAYAGGPAHDFETQGTLVVDVLSASPLEFDAGGNLLVGGGDFSQSGETGYVALLRVLAIAAALAGGGPANTSDPTQVRRLDPDPANAFEFYGTVANRTLSRVYVRDFGMSEVHVYFPASPFATSALEYAPAPGQFVANPKFNDPKEALGPPSGGGISAPNNESVVTLGGFGGYIVLGFDHTVMDEPLNPMGLDAIVFSNAYWVGGNPDRHWAECATIEISRDDNDNGLADDPWYLIPGSHLTAPVSQTLKSWSDGSTTYAYGLPADPFHSIVVINPASGSENEGVFGYGEYAPTLYLGDLDGDDVIDDEEISPENFYTIPDDPLEVGITPGAGGGDAFDIGWAIDPATGNPAGVEGFDFVRLTNPTDFVAAPIGEKSPEIDAVADVTADPFGDADADGDIDLVDVAELQGCMGEPRDSQHCQALALDQAGVIDVEDAAMVLARFTGPNQ